MTAVLVLSSERYCACGCGASLQGRQANTRYVDGSHRARACKARAKSRPVRRVKPSGLQVSYSKAVREVAKFLAAKGGSPLPETWAIGTAESILAEALPERQRARLR